MATFQIIEGVSFEPTTIEVPFRLSENQTIADVASPELLAAFQTALTAAAPAGKSCSGTLLFHATWRDAPEAAGVDPVQIFREIKLVENTDSGEITLVRSDGTEATGTLVLNAEIEQTNPGGKVIRRAPGGGRFYGRVLDDGSKDEGLEE